MDAAPDYEALYSQALGALRTGAEAFRKACDTFDEVVQDLKALDTAARAAEGEAGADADEDGDDEAGDTTLPDNGLEGCGVCTQFTPCPNPGIGCFVVAPPLDPCTDCDDSDDEFCGYHSEGGLPLTHGGTYPCPGPGKCDDFDCPCPG